MTKVSAKSLINELNDIKTLNEQIKVVIEKMPICTIRSAFEYSTANIDKKIARFTAPSNRLILDDEEREIIEKFRAEKAKKEVSEIRPDEGTSSHESSDDKKTRKKNK